MVLDDIFERFAQQSPVSVMVRAALEHTLSPRTIDALFERTAQRQYPRSLLFSSVVDLMGAVVAKIQPAVNAAYRARAETLGVSGEGREPNFVIITQFCQISHFLAPSGKRGGRVPSSSPAPFQLPHWDHHHGVRLTLQR